jgi:hypothetical protein
MCGWKICVICCISYFASPVLALLLNTSHSLHVAQLWGGVAQSWGGVAQLAARRLAVRQARVRFSARPHREVSPTEHTSDEDMERGFNEWRRMNVYCD